MTSPAASSRRRVAFLAGNGHVDGRLASAREAARRLPEGRAFEVVSVEYGAHATFDELLDSVDEQLRGAALVYATGIGGLVALALRARGRAEPSPTILQGPVLWGLETRRFPRLMRLPLMPRLLVLALGTGFARRRFVRKHFQREPDAEFLRVFFDGYRDADAFRHWFAWLTPALLRRLEAELRGRADRLARLEAWWGRDDHVVGPQELALTEAALAVEIPLRTFHAWGHYPMIDDPDGWTQEVADAVDAASGAA